MNMSMKGKRFSVYQRLVGLCANHLLKSQKKVGKRGDIIMHVFGIDHSGFCPSAVNSIRLCNGKDKYSHKIPPMRDEDQFQDWARVVAGMKNADDTVDVEKDIYAKIDDAMVEALSQLQANGYCLPDPDPEPEPEQLSLSDISEPEVEKTPETDSGSLLSAVLGLRAEISSLRSEMNQLRAEINAKDKTLHTHIGRLQSDLNNLRTLLMVKPVPPDVLERLCDDGKPMANGKDHTR